MGTPQTNPGRGLSGWDMHLQVCAPTCSLTRTQRYPVALKPAALSTSSKIWQTSFLDRLPTSRLVSNRMPCRLWHAHNIMYHVPVLMLLNFLIHSITVHMHSSCACAFGSCSKRRNVQDFKKFDLNRTHVNVFNPLPIAIRALADAQAYTAQAFGF